MTAEAALDTMVDRIVTRFHPRCVVLFGSRARGAATAQADVDLLVVMDRLRQGKVFYEQS